MDAGSFRDDLEVGRRAAVLIAAHGVHQAAAANGLIVFYHLQLDIEIAQGPFIVRREQAAGTMDHVLMGHCEP